MNKPFIVIPTFNRSAKLARVINCYASWKIRPLIYILDVSTDGHLKSNILLSNAHKNVVHIVCPRHLGFSMRLLWWLESNQPEGDLLLIGNDEDPFIENYFLEASRLMTDDNSLSTVIGSYICCKKSFFSLLPQLSLERMLPFPFDLNGNLDGKLHTHITLNSTGRLPPLFFSIRRKLQLYDALRYICSHELMESTEELIDQLFLIQCGTIRFLSEPMLLRDETRLNYYIEPSRHDPDAYIPLDELEVSVGVLLNCDSLCIYSRLKSIYLSESSSNYSNRCLDYFSLLPRGVPSLACGTFTNISRISRFFYVLNLRLTFFLNIFAIMFFRISNGEKFFLFCLLFFPFEVNRNKHTVLFNSTKPISNIQSRIQ